jgi:hypothetical protein
VIVSAWFGKIKADCCSENIPESFATKIDRWQFNFFPAYRGTGARVLFISHQHREMRIKIPLNW